MFDFGKDYCLTNKRVALSPLTKPHEDFLFEAANDPQIWQHFEEDGYGKANFKQYISRALQKRAEQIAYPFVIKDLKTEKYAGMTRVYAVNNSLKNVKIGHTWIGSHFQATGLNKHCKYLLFEFLFDELQMERIGFGASAENIKSIKAMESVGCKQEGRLRHFLPTAHSTARVDIVLLSILKHEWDAKIKADLKKKIAGYW